MALKSTVATALTPDLLPLITVAAGKKVEVKRISLGGEELHTGDGLSHELRLVVAVSDNSDAQKETIIGDYVYRSDNRNRDNTSPDNGYCGGVFLDTSDVLKVKGVGTVVAYYDENP